MAMQNGRDPMKGRTGVGGKLASPGKIRRGQPEPASNKFKTNARPEVSRKSPLVPDNAKTSADAQVMIREAPDPFKNNQQATTIPAPSGPRGSKPGPVQKPYANLQNRTVGNRALPPGRPVGQGQAINQSGQIGGRMGFPPPKKRAGNNASGYPVKKKANAFFGDYGNA